MCKFGLIILCALSAGCGMSVSYLPGKESKGIAAMHTVAFELEVVCGAVSTERAGAAYTGSSAAVVAGADSVMDGKQQAELAAKDMLFELGAAGISAASSAEKADAVAQFSIGAVRYRKEWIADQAFLEFRDPVSGDLIGTFRADAGSNPRPVRDFTRALARKIGKTVAKARGK